MSLFTSPAAEYAEMFATSVVKHFPGGPHIGPHLDDGPWRMLVISRAEEVNWLVEEAFAAYPSAQLPGLDPWTGTLVSFTAYLLPQFAYDLAYYWSGEGSYHVLEEAEVEWPQLPEPGTRDRDAVVALLVDNDDDYNANLAAVVDLVGPRQVAHRATALIESGQVEPDDWYATVAAWLAAAGTPVPTVAP